MRVFGTVSTVAYNVPWESGFAMQFNATRVLANARAAQTDDLLDRVTAFRAGMEPEAIELFEMELRRRGVTSDQIERHAQRYENCLLGSNGVPLNCSWCRRPAVASGWGWHRLWRRLPIFPRRYRYCSEHLPSVQSSG
jgi:hypothetical protein